MDITLDDGATGRASVPSGASTGSSEAHELRDADPEDYAGFGVKKAVGHVNGEIAGSLRGADAFDQQGIDSRLVALDGTAQLRRLGANAILGCSLAIARAAASSRKMPLYEYIKWLTGGGFSVASHAHGEYFERRTSCRHGAWTCRISWLYPRAPRRSNKRSEMLRGFAPPPPNFSPVVA